MTVNVTQVSDLILINWRLRRGLDLSVQVRSGRWPVLFQGMLAALILLFSHIDFVVSV